MTLAGLKSSKNGVDRVHNERVARDAKTRFPRCFNMGKLTMEMRQKREK